MRGLKLTTLLICFFLGLSFTAFSKDLVKPCESLSFVELNIIDLLKDYEKLSRFDAKKLAVELILRQCQHEKDKGSEGIRIRDGKVKFSEFSDTYNTQDPVYFCKNNRGYRSYLSQMTHKLLQFKEDKEKKEGVVKAKPRNNKPRKPAQKKEPVKEPMWNCVIPNYIKTVKRVNKNQMETLSITYGPNSCSKAH
ncbi:MAG: hypothetical protein ACJAT2_002578 [Bacteriovoracaceae bacterium]|jgi:hypothetical protein